MKTPYEQGFERGYYKLAHIEMYAEYSKANLEYRQGWANGVMQAKLELDKYNEFLDNRKREKEMV